LDAQGRKVGDFVVEKEEINEEEKNKEEEKEEEDVFSAGIAYLDAQGRKVGDFVADVINYLLITPAKKNYWFFYWLFSCWTNKSSFQNTLTSYK